MSAREDETTADLRRDEAAIGEGEREVKTLEEENRRERQSRQNVMLALCLCVAFGITEKGAFINAKPTGAS